MADEVPGDPSGGGSSRQQLETELLLAMRKTGAVMQLLGLRAADRLGINPTDLNCMNIVALSGSMTAGELARATGLTTASITGVLDRLEEAGFVRRERDPADRRRVVVKLSDGPRLREVGPVFAPMIQALQGALAGYDEGRLRTLLEFQRQLEEAVGEHLARLKEADKKERT
jgi:DNA-binding MarR family transcriptional regulator